MFRRTPLFLLLILLGLAAQAQLQPLSHARLRTPSGSLQGYVRNQPRTATPQYFDFAPDANGPFRRYTASELLRVELDDSTVFERYRVRVPVMGKPVADRRQSDYRPEVYVDGYVLLEQLLEGAPALYGYTDSFEVEHFFYRLPADSGVQAIRYEPYESAGEQGQYAYRNDLERLGITSGCGDRVANDVRYVTYDTRAMIRYFQQLNACAGNTARVVGRFNKTVQVVRAGLLAGGRYASHFATMPYQGSARSNGLGPVAGAWLDFFPRRQNTNLVLGMSLAYTWTNALGNGDKVLRAPSAALDYQCLYFDVSGRRLLGNGRWRPFLEGGLQLGVFTSGTSSYVVAAPGGNLETIGYRLGGTNSELLAGAGVGSPLLSVHLRYNQPFLGDQPFRSHFVSLTARVALVH